MLKRICITVLEIDVPEREIVVVAWPWSNSVRDLTPEMARAVSRAVGGLPVVLLASSSQGIHSFGSPERTAAAVALDFRSIPWRLIDVRDDEMEAALQAA